MGKGWILVTGGGRGIGKAISLECARRGYDLAITYNTGKSVAESTSAEIKKLGVSCETFHMAAQDRKSYREFVDDIISRGIQFAGLVNNAGIYKGESLQETTDESWDEVIEVNLSTPFRLVRDLKSVVSDGGSIVNIASVYGLKSDPWGYAYQATKAALIHLTRSMVKEFAPGIRVNCVAPGFIATEMNAEDRKDEKFKSFVEKRTPLKRWGKAEEVAFAVCFLLSPESSFITGHTMVVDGGISL